MKSESIVVGVIIICAVLFLARHVLRGNRKTGCGCDNCPARNIPKRIKR